MRDHGLEKAYIEVKDTGVQIRCRFNPKEYTVAKSAEWKRTAAKGAKSASRAEFVGTNGSTLQMELFFDGWDSGLRDVSDDVEALIALTTPTSKSHKDNKPIPPTVVFGWGNKQSWNAYVKSVSAKYTMFSPEGVPIRATVNVQFEEVGGEVATWTNPTSGGDMGRRAHLVVEGDSLQSIAYAEYGDATVWRRIAEANAIDDPLCLVSGSTVMVPPADHAAGPS